MVSTKAKGRREEVEEEGVISCTSREPQCPRPEERVPSSSSTTWSSASDTHT